MNMIPGKKLALKTDATEAVNKAESVDDLSTLVYDSTY